MCLVTLQLDGYAHALFGGGVLDCYSDGVCSCCDAAVTVCCVVWMLQNIFLIGVGSACPKGISNI